LRKDCFRGSNAAASLKLFTMVFDFYYSFFVSAAAMPRPH